MPLPQQKPLRWSLNQVVLEFGVTANKVRRGFRIHGIEPGRDGKHSTREIATALFGMDGLEKKAREAKLQAQIDEAAFHRDRRREQEKRLVDVGEVKDFAADLVATFVSAIRHSSMTEAEKQTAIRQLRELNYETHIRGNRKKHSL